ncbi:MAG: hypothetical protein OEY26_05055, partial [Nitrospinota bacterium]|nr:hypothetical protein [Nitrospinota bacterium]
LWWRGIPWTETSLGQPLISFPVSSSVPYSECIPTSQSSQEKNHLKFPGSTEVSKELNNYTLCNREGVVAGKMFDLSVSTILQKINFLKESDLEWALPHF